MRSPIAGAGVTMQNCGTRCPRCGGDARILDGTMMPGGLYKVKDLFDFVSKLQDTETLHKVKTVLESANDQAYAEDLIDALTEIDPAFEKFKTAIKNLPYSKLEKLVDKLLVLIGILVTYYAIVRTDEANKANLQLQEQQYELNRAQFEYQMDRDKSESELKEKIRELRESIEEDIHEPTRETPRKGKLRGCDRNNPCPCGSGKKYKKCHPNGYVV
jgi:hypothetical protein